MDKKTVGVGALVAFIVALGVTYFVTPEPSIPGTNVVREIVREIKDQVGAVPVLTEISAGPICIEGACEWPKGGTCSDATSTIFAVQNPFRATSTVSFVNVRGKNGTTSIDILVGTSTTPAIITNKATSTAPVGITPSLIATAFIGTSSSFFLHNNMNWDVNGADRTSYSGYNSLFHPGFRSYFNTTISEGTGRTSTTTVQTRIVLGPDDYIIGLATSTFLYSDAANLNGNQGVTNASNAFSCNYSVKFER